VIKSEGHTLVIRVGDDDVRVSASRVTRAPKPLVEIHPKGTLWIQPLGICQILLPTRQKSRSMSLKRSSAFAKPTMGLGCIECGGMATRVMMTRGSQPTISREMLCGDTTDAWGSRSENNSMLCLLANTRYKCFKKQED
jgi:hypothetical protein